MLISKLLSSLSGTRDLKHLDDSAAVYVTNTRLMTDCMNGVDYCLLRSIEVYKSGFVSNISTWPVSCQGGRGVARL